MIEYIVAILRTWLNQLFSKCVTNLLVKNYFIVMFQVMQWLKVRGRV